MSRFILGYVTADEMPFSMTEDRLGIFVAWDVVYVAVQGGYDPPIPLTEATWYGVRLALESAGYVLVDKLLGYGVDRHDN